ncbi:MAG: 2-amino-4-hydroxy-6-hydroxymethyldihydropteridine diphosphokinase [Candidatus Aureabacteria bacterium]|nr:2-amino-4-hydroxy-6-hydroxymethyldihydropteridine diphosphokinase [Candidatus Auribacterota bacterium]
MSSEVYIGIGSNLGCRFENIDSAVSFLKKERGIESVFQASFYESAPVDISSKKNFLNTVVKIKTELSPFGLLERLKHIEKILGRKQTKSGDRVIDLDILLYKDEVVDGPVLKIPHPKFHKRLFVLVPLTEISGDIKHPLHGEKLSCFIESLKDSKQFIKKVER